MRKFGRLFQGKKAKKNLSLKGAFSRIKSEFEEHLDTINQNTNEIQANYEFLCEIESKIDKLCQRLDEMQMSVSQSKPNVILGSPVRKLSKREQEVFMVMYTSNEDLTYLCIARKLGLKEEMVRNYISSVTSKGVPIVKKFDSNKVFLSIDPDFVDLQAKENILEIDEGFVKEFVKV